MIRVFHFASVINRYDFIDSVLTNLNRSQFEISALTVTSPQNRRGNYSKEEEYTTKSMELEFSRWNYRKIFSKLKKEIEEFQPHILQTHHYDESVMGSILAKKMKIPVFVVGHHYSDHIYVLSKGPRRMAYLEIERACNNVADKLVVPTQEVVDLLLKQKVPAQKIKKIPFGTDFGMVNNVSEKEVDNIRSKFNIDKKFTALTCCRLNKEKGLDFLIKAVPAIRKRFPNFQLIMVGEGPYRQVLEGIRNELNLEDCVKFVGWKKDALNWYSASDIVIQPSISESFCQVLIEALVLKKPVIMTPVGVAPEVIINNERGGCLIPIGDSESITEEVCKLIDDPELRIRLAEGGFRYVKENMTTETTAREYEQLYSELIEKKQVEV